MYQKCKKKHLWAAIPPLEPIQGFLTVSSTMLQAVRPDKKQDAFVEAVSARQNGSLMLIFLVKMCSLSDPSISVKVSELYPLLLSAGVFRR